MPTIIPISLTPITNSNYMGSSKQVSVPVGRAPDSTPARSDGTSTLKDSNPGSETWNGFQNCEDTSEKARMHVLEDRFMKEGLRNDHDALEPISSSINSDCKLTRTVELQPEHEHLIEPRVEKMEVAVRTLLECIGEDPDREGLRDTPARCARALQFLTMGYQARVDDMVNNALFDEDHDEMVMVQDIDIFSLCEHHLLPFTGKMHIAYVPSRTVIGLSKLARIADMYSRRLQIQERLTKDVANAVMRILEPQGVAVIMESSHLCMAMRGVEKTDATTITSCMLGCFKDQGKTPHGFFELLRLHQ